MCDLSFREKKIATQGVWGLLAHMVDKSTLKVALDNVPIVWEFQDVFLKDLLGLPIDWEFEFWIKLLPGSAPIFISLCKMAPVELKELKTQL